MKLASIFEKYINLRKQLDQSKIYKITDNTNDKIYIGSTCQTLKERLSGHKSEYKRFLKGLSRNVRSFGILKNNNYKIELLENCNIKTKDELTARERFYIENNECVNRCIPGRTRKEYKENNKDKIKEQDKTYRDANKDKINEKNKAYKENNKDKIKEQDKTYRDANKEKKRAYYEANQDKIREHNNEKFDCECGGKYTYINKMQHLKTDKHKKYLEI